MRQFSTFHRESLYHLLDMFLLQQLTVISRTTKGKIWFPWRCWIAAVRTVSGNLWRQNVTTTTGDQSKWPPRPISVPDNSPVKNLRKMEKERTSVTWSFPWSTIPASKNEPLESNRGYGCIQLHVKVMATNSYWQLSSKRSQGNPCSK